MGERVAWAESRRLALLGLAIAGWLIGFELLRRTGSWAPFVLIGPAIAGLALWVDAEARALMRWSLRGSAVGLLVGALMVAATHVVFTVVAPPESAVRGATVGLLELLDLGGFPVAGRTALIALVASSEEIIFRGAILGRAAGRGERLLQRVTRADWLRIVASAAAYGLAMATLGSGLLIACAFACGIVWGWLRVATRSLWVPILVHVVWVVAMVELWPLVEPS